MGTLREESPEEASGKTILNRESARRRLRPKAKRADGQTDEYAPRTLRTETGARSQLRLLTTTERPSSRRWEEGEAALVQYGSGLV